MINMRRFAFAFFAILCMSFGCEAPAQERGVISGGSAGGTQLGLPPQMPQSANQANGFGRKNSQPSENEQQSAINKLLLVSQQLFAQKKYDEALAKLKEADAIPNKTSEEKLFVDQTKIAIAA